jgi:hypothetical protein
VTRGRLGNLRIWLGAVAILVITVTYVVANWDGATEDGRSTGRALFNGQDPYQVTADLPGYESNLGPVCYESSQKWAAQNKASDSEATSFYDGCVDEVEHQNRQRPVH